MRGFLLTFLMA